MSKTVYAKRLRTRLFLKSIVTHHEFTATRKPMFVLESNGGKGTRREEEEVVGGSFQPPPRVHRRFPLAAPSGSVTAPAE